MKSVATSAMSEAFLWKTILAKANAQHESRQRWPRFE